MILDFGSKKIPKSLYGMEPLIEGRNQLTGAPLPEDWADRLRCFMNRVRFHLERGDQENDATAQARLGFGHLQPLQCTVIVNVYCNAQFL